MSLDYWKMHPDAEETRQSYSQRLQDDGHEEMLIRKALGVHFEMPLSEMSEFFEDFELARLRHIKLLTEIHPNRTDYSLMKKVSSNLGVSEERASALIDRFRNTDPEQLKYIR